LTEVSEAVFEVLVAAGMEVEVDEKSEEEGE
jgi:hypothetical protein